MSGANNANGARGFPPEHPLAIHMLGMHGSKYANIAINETDLMLAVGVHFDDRVTGNVDAFIRDGKIIHIDLDGDGSLNMTIHELATCRRYGIGVKVVINN